MQVGGIRILRKAYLQETGDPQKMISYITYSTIVHALQRRVGPPGTRRKAATRNTPEVSACMENEKRKLCPSLIFYFQTIILKIFFYCIHDMNELTRQTHLVLHKARAFPKAREWASG
jgi:hypothetical protein